LLPVWAQDFMGKCRTVVPGVAEVVVDDLKLAARMGKTRRVARTLYSTVMFSWWIRCGFGP
jgi:hypothetical protein